MKYTMINQKGYSIVYGLIVLMLATVAGTAILFMTQKDRAAVADYAGTRFSSQAAGAALEAVEGQLLKFPDSSVACLKKYGGDNNYKWLLDTIPANANSEHKIKISDNGISPQYSARIVGYDVDNSYVIVEGIGYDGLGGKKKAIASYQLSGLTTMTYPTTNFGCYIGGGCGNLDQSLVIMGDCFLGSGNHGNYNGGDGLTINGNLKTGTGLFELMAPLTVNGKAFFRGSAQFSRTVTISNKAGFQGASLNLAMNLNIATSIFLNCDDNGAGLVNVTGGTNTAYYNTDLGYDPAKISATNKVPWTTSNFNIPAQLGMSDVDDLAPLIANSGNLEGYITSHSGTVYSPSGAGLTETAGWGLLNAWNTKTKWNNFLCIKVTDADNTNFCSNNQGGQFTKKAIWIIERAGLEGSKWYYTDATTNSNNLIYLKGNGTFNNFGEGWTGANKFRGVIYNGSTTASKTMWKFQAGSKIIGSFIYNATAQPQFNYKGNASDTLAYDASVINEFVTAGAITIPTQPGVIGGISSLRLVDLKIRPALLGIQM